MFKKNNEIKKRLYRQKPTATLLGRGNAAEAYVYGFSETIWPGADEGDFFYSAQVQGEYTTRLFFRIPEEEAKNEDGELIFKNEEPAQLLIRWLI